jgi:hypothetical protein
MARKASVLSNGLRTTPTQRTTKEKTYFVFSDIDLERAEARECLFGRDNSAGVARCQGEI